MERRKKKYPIRDWEEVGKEWRSVRKRMVDVCKECACCESGSVATQRETQNTHLTLSCHESEFPCFRQCLPRVTLLS